MTSTCFACRQPLPEDSHTIDLQRVAQFMADPSTNPHRGGEWSDYLNWAEGRKEYVTGLGEVELVAKGKDLDDDDEGPVFVVIRFGSALIRMDGHQDSYGNTSWSGYPRPVSRVEKTVTQYVYE